MKPVLASIAALILLTLSGCKPEEVVMGTATPSAMPILIQSDTAAPSTIVVPITPTATENASSSTLEITKADNGRTINMLVGDSFLLHLDADFYDWEVEVDRQNVLSRAINITVINGAQGIYQANEPGTATLTASGNPKCLNSNPPCLSPSIIFTITVVVQ